MNTGGQAFTTLLREAEEAGQAYGIDSVEVIQRTVENLLRKQTSGDNPGMLLGMIQSGKTKTFLGVIALAADNGFDLFIVLTKGTRALTTQTYERLKKAFDTIVDLDDIRVFDIMTFPKLTLREQRLPLVVVAKKEVRNLERLTRALFETYPDLSKRRVLIVDDEADFASIGFKKSKSEEAELQRVMGLINGIRSRLKNASFLQVTATPYSLYLQPTHVTANDGETFMPTRPAFTEIVPTHDAYIGGNFYFERAQESGSVASFLYHAVNPLELEVLHHADRRRFNPDEALTSKGVPSLRQAIVTFVVGALMRRLQAKHLGEKPKKYSFIIHTEYSKQAHTWQELVVEALVEGLRESATKGTKVFHDLVRTAHDDLRASIQAANGYVPELASVLEEVEEYLPAIQVEKVNSEKDVMQLLDRDGQLELRNKLNIFIGGQILDRGLTIGNLIGFYYGRRAHRFQQDTVLQHARMYGARPLADLAVTRFYTSPGIYQVLRTVHEFDAGLRHAFRSTNQNVAFIRKADNLIIPCSPNKILISTLTTLRAGKRLLPVGFQTGYKSNIARIVQKLDSRIAAIVDTGSSAAPALVPLAQAIDVVDLIALTHDKEEDSAYHWNVDAVKASMEYVSMNPEGAPNRGMVYILARTNRRNVRIRREGRPFDAPDTAHVEGAIATKVAINLPMLMLFRQEGLKDDGWRDCPFWWPVLYMPQMMTTVVFASDFNDYDEDVSGGSVE